MVSEALISVERENDIAWLRLQRADRLNALTTEMRLDLLGALEEVRASPPHVLIITGAGRGFCTGQDLGERVSQLERGEVPNLGDSLDRTYNALIRSITSLPCLTIAAVNGVAAGAGIGLALACDIVVAARSARFMLAFGKIGLAPDAGVSWLLPRRIGEARALALTLSGDPITADQALDWGLVYALHEDEALGAGAHTLAVALAEGSLSAQLAARALIRQPGRSLSEQLDKERDAQDGLGRTDFFRERVLSFARRS